MALLGGLVLVALVALTCLSVLGRGLDTLGHSDALKGTGLGAWLAAAGPIPGDFELVQAGMAFTIFAFLPLTQLRAEHAAVDLFASGLPPAASRRLAAVWEAVLAIAALVVAWRLLAGTQAKYGNGQTSFLLQFPVWWAYAASLAAAAVAALVGVYCAAMRALGRPPA